MNVKEINDEISKKGFFTCFAPKFRKKIDIIRVEKVNGRTFGIWKDGDKEKLIDIKYLSLEDKEEKVICKNKPRPFPEDKKDELETNEEEIFAALRLLGKNRQAVLKVLKPEMQNAMKKTMMTKIMHSKKNEFNRIVSTVRTAHYANTAMVAFKIAEGLFPDDKDLQLGIATCALYHDYGQDPFGHDGEKAIQDASEEMNGGPQPHNARGADELRFREYDNIKKAINAGEIIEVEAKKRVKSRLNISEISKLNSEQYREYINAVNEEIEEINNRLEFGAERELEKAIKDNSIKNGNLADKAVQLIIMSAGNHNGERGIAHIIPDYNLNYDDFCKNIRQTYVNHEANSKLPICTIVDAIVKLSDQISSIPFDMIDGVRSGIENQGDISKKWVAPVAKILQIPAVDADNRLKGNENELRTLALEIQDKLIESVIKSSNIRELDMDLQEVLYGELRGPNLSEHILKTSPPGEYKTLSNLSKDLMSILVSNITDEHGIFPPNLNWQFRLPKDSEERIVKESELLEEFKGDKNLLEFYRYCLNLSKEEYEYNKAIVKELDLNKKREIIENAIKKRKGEYIDYSEEESPMQLAVDFALNSDLFAKERFDKTTYSDDDIKEFIKDINLYLKVNPIGEIKKFKTPVSKTRYKGQALYMEEQFVDIDQQIAARIAANYLGKLNDIDLIELANHFKLITEKELENLNKTYNKETIESCTEGAAKDTMSAYNGSARDRQKDEKLRDD